MHPTHLSHWGAFTAEIEGDRLVSVQPHAEDPDPSPLIENFLDSLDHAIRIQRPAFRAGWLDNGPGPDERRGKDRFIELPWPRALDLLGRELRWVYGEFGAEAVYGGSYGWSSAGRFHHAQSQLHRFLRCLGGYVDGSGNYSKGASDVLLPHVLGIDGTEYARRYATSWKDLTRHADLIVAFGGIPLKNAAVRNGGVLQHMIKGSLKEMCARGTKFVLFSPIRSDLPDWIGAKWYPLRPATDVAVMLALAYVLANEKLHSREFLDRYCSGWEVFERYLLGRDDAQPKDPDWAAALSGVPAAAIAELARRLPRSRTLITTTWSLQRMENGEQPVWMSIVLAAMLGQIGLPGGGFGHGYGSSAACGTTFTARMPALPQGKNPVTTSIPVARVADMLLHPGRPYEFNGKNLTYPHVRVIYWCGGNPFHHHQDLYRLRRALARPDTIVTHEPFWTPMARHADIVLPCTTTLERNDFSGGTNGSHLLAMPRVLSPMAESRDDYWIFSELAERLGFAPAFTESRNEMQWLEHLYESWRAKIGAALEPLPSFSKFWSAGRVDLRPLTPPVQVFLADFRRDPVAHRLGTPTGRIEIFSKTIASFGYEECPGHPVWREASEWLGSRKAASFPLQLVANNPATRLHSQLDHGRHSRKSKIRSREPIRMHPADALARGISDGDLVRIFNERGACLAGVVLTSAIMRGVVQLSTGAWFDPQEVPGVGKLCAHGNPNVLTADRGTSRLGQGCTGQLTLVQVERFVGDPPSVLAWVPPSVQRLA